MDLLKDPVLSSVISMVAPTWCHGATGGKPFAGDCGRIWLQNWHFSIGNSLSKVEQTAFPFFAIFWEFPLLLWSQWSLRNASLSVWSRSELPETFRFAAAWVVSRQHIAWLIRQAGTPFPGVVPFLLMVLWWGWTFRASNSMELEQPFMPLWRALTTVPKGNNARYLL